MKKIVIISGSVRNGRRTHGIAKYILDYINEFHRIETELVDLKAYQFPVFEERFRYTENPSEGEMKYRNLIQETDAVILVSPEYNLGIPAAVKNAVDYLNDEWVDKTIGFVNVSAGIFGARNLWGELIKLFIHLKAKPSSTGLFYPQVQKNFNDNGQLVNKEEMDKRTKVFIDKLLFPSSD